ncbi:tyrosine-type recombinase/integrase [Staphylococcus cohnii]|mgnify:FL=1|uniref:Tyrosine-type recombinase/integrase n=2 Tax=Staphylococcus cohnii TaxID=29382 RepID=A0ABT6IYC0_9STAP|nr:tyrosine-type recombinase/integrase [Staphylococcus cohnii]TGP63451.1 integrase [bacterium M00.F.Ca.ET.229.01.1.1]TGS39533.1 integrase [bacterium M00.F.Ca.ET.180.01.1.1]AYX89043.1 integrase [Staphylococcus cohnii]KKI64323.1 DNA integration/recombination/inversion protein [Staphylococcus cohnii subsp. cohnii]MCI2940435.1 tyrosine-type recombinase/integrase [Staphylococcus cohnii]
MNQVDPIRNTNEIKAMYEVLKAKSMRDYLLFKFAIHTGVKLSSLLNLNVSDVKIEDDDIKHYWIESHAPKIQIRLPETLRNELMTYISEQQLKNDELLFQSNRTLKGLSRQQAYRIIHLAAEDLGMLHIGLTTLRKTFAYHAYQSGISISIIQKYLGHQTTFETMKFIGISTKSSKTTIALNL